MLNGLCMDHKPSLSDIARIAGVTKPTVSIVLNGKGDKGRICRDTQSRIRAVARDLGYQKQSTMPVPMPDAATGEPPKMVGLLLSTASPASTLALIPGRDSTVSMEGCRLVVVTLPQDLTTARARVASLIQEGFVSFICCPTAYTVAASTSTVPVTKLEVRNQPVTPAQTVPATPVCPATPLPTPAPIPQSPPVIIPAPEPAPVTPDPVVEDTPVAVADEEPPTATEPPMEAPAPEMVPEEPAPTPAVTLVEEPAVTPAPEEPVETSPVTEPPVVTPEAEPVEGRRSSPNPLSWSQSPRLNQHL